VPVSRNDGAPKKDNNRAATRGRSQAANPERHRSRARPYPVASSRSMIIPVTTTGRHQQRYDHRLGDLVQRTGDVTIATNLGIPRSTAREWLRKTPTVVVSLDVTNQKTAELQREVLELRRRVKKLTALLRLVVVLLRTSGFRLTHERLPDGRAKVRILRAIDHVCPLVPLRAILRFLRLSPSRFHAWRRLQHACALDDQSSCPHMSPHRLTPAEIQTIRGMVTAVEYRHVPTGTLAILAQRRGEVWASPSTWYRLVRTYGWRRPRLRVHPAKPKVGLRTTRANEMWHIDTTVIRLLDGTRAYLHAVIDNFSRRILAWRVADTFAPVNTVAVLVNAGRSATPPETIPVVLADAGVENVNAQVDELITAGVLRRVLAFTELKFSNSMIEACGVRSNISGCSSTHWIVSPRSGDWWSSTSSNTTGCCPIRRFADKRPTKCTSGRGMRFQPT
jgi:putative transposase